MTDKKDEELARALSEFLVPWDWEDVILSDYKDEYFDWCRNRNMIFGQDFYMHIDEPNQSKPKGKWPFPEYETKHHYLFKDPANATAFALTFLT
jgi:hypothetical protein